MDGHQNTLYEFNAATLSLAHSYNLLSPDLNSGAVDVAVSRSSNKVFVLDGNTFGDPLELEVVDVSSKTVWRTPWHGLGGWNTNE